MSQAGGSDNEPPITTTYTTPMPRLTVASLRRSSPGQFNPTRTLMLEEEEHSSRETTPIRHTLESLARRPRSNPRTRTPNRYESPLSSSEFRRASLIQDNEPVRNEGRRISINRMAGAAIGAAAPMIIREGRHVTPQSHKQGPSHRKLRRWNNDSFSALAAEIKSGNLLVADHLLKAQEDAHLYRAIYDPKDHVCEKLNSFLTEGKHRELCERFFDGELPHTAAETTHLLSKSKSQLMASDRLDRIENRLRNVLVKACCSHASPAAKVVALFDEYVWTTFSKAPSSSSTNTLPQHWWKGLLLKPPQVTRRTTKGGCTLLFSFDAVSSTGGFYRILLHAVAQFYNLPAVSRVAVHGKTTTRALIVSGELNADESMPRRRILECITSMDGGGPSKPISIGCLDANIQSISVDDEWQMV